MPSGAKKRKAAKKKQKNHHTNHGDEEVSKQQSRESRDSHVEQQKPTEEENSTRVERELNVEDESATKNGSSKNSVGSSRSYSSSSNYGSDSEESYDDANIDAILAEVGMEDDDEDSKQQSQEDKHRYVDEEEGIEDKESQTERIEQQKPTAEGNSVQVEREFDIENESAAKNGSSKNGYSPTSNHGSDSEESYDDAKIDAILTEIAMEDDKEDSKQQSHDDEGAQREDVEQKNPTEEESPILDETEFNIEDESAMKNSEPSLKPTSDNESQDDANNKISGRSAVEEEEEAIDSISAKSPSIDLQKIPVVSAEEGEYSLNTPLIGSVVEEEDGQEKQTYVEVNTLSEMAIPIEKNDGNLGVSYTSVKPTSDIGVVSEDDSGLTQPYIAEPPRPTQRTSWKGCCGIFELFGGSDR